MAVFDSCSVLLDLKCFPFKEKKKLKSAVTENGGNISFVVNKQCSLIVTSDVSSLSSNRLRSIQKHQTPVVGVDYVFSCLERGVLLPVDEYKLDTATPSVSLPPLPLPPPGTSPVWHQVSEVPTSKAPQRAETSGKVLGKHRIYTETDSDLPTYPDHFHVAKYSIFEKINSNTWCVLELQSVKGEKGRQYRVVRYWKDDVGAKKAAVKDKLVFLSTSEEALEVYKAQKESLQATGLQLRSDIPPQAQELGSAPLQQLLLEEKLNTGSLSQDVGVFVELLWTEALGCLDSILAVSIDKLSLNDVSRVEGLLLQAQRKLMEANHTEVASLLDEVYTLLPHREPQRPANAKLLSQKLDLCQVIRDILNVSEMTLRSPVPSCVGKYRALRCSIETVPPSSSEFQAVTALLQDSKVQIQQVLRVSRGVELQTFKSELGNIKPLLHSSSPSNFVGVLSRGMLLPRVGVEHHGIERTDVGNLGSGIYFSDAVSTSLKYSKPSVTDGSRLLLVCDVALGRCRDDYKKDLTLTQAPEGHHSVHGVRHTRNTLSEFEDDEYVVYSPDQVKLKYVVQFSVEGDQLKEFSPAIDTSAEPCLPSSDPALGSEDDGVEIITNPLEGVKAGLLDSSGQQLPLQAVHVKCKLMDLLSQVIIFQKYTNLSSVPIEAKYVFPLDDSAAVCGFEAFINGKHVVGQVKEKETARKEYRQAIEKGHGAYLMDQDAPDVFTISVGNLPPGATVLIKVTFVSELIVRDGSILFSLPGSVAPWQESAALNQTTQVTVEKLCVTDEAASTREFTLDMSVEMPHEISSVTCITHQVKIKRTDCKAVVSVLPGEVMGAEGFQLSVTLSEVHLPRMWVEKHPDKDSQACMLVFYPDFDVDSSSASDEVVLLLDTSESMKGESLLMAQKIALQVLKTLDRNLRVQVIFFGTDHTETVPTAQPLAEARQSAESFIKCSPPVGGSTELWRPLRALSLLPPSRGARNLLLLSDGHIQNPELTLQLLRDNAQHSRLFACGLSPTANRHMLRALAQAGGGAFEFFDTKTKHNWAEKVACQVKRMASPGCSSVSVKWQQFNPTAPPPVQAPKQLHALFNDCHTLVYGFVPHCTQATLLGNLSGQELKTMVSTSELQKTRGTFLHKLTARALIRDYEGGSLDTNEAEHEGKKAELKHFIIELSKEFSILSQFTSFVAIEERDSDKTEEGFTDIPKLIAEEDVDFLPYISWISPQDSEEGEKEGSSSESYLMEEDDYYEDDGERTEEDESGVFPSDLRSEGSRAVRYKKARCRTNIEEELVEMDSAVEAFHMFRSSLMQSRCLGSAVLPPPPPPPLPHLCNDPPCQSFYHPFPRSCQAPPFVPRKDFLHRPTAQSMSVETHMSSGNLWIPAVRHRRSASSKPSILTEQASYMSRARTHRRALVKSDLTDGCHDMEVGYGSSSNSMNVLSHPVPASSISSLTELFRQDAQLAPETTADTAGTTGCSFLVQENSVQVEQQPSSSFGVSEAREGIPFGSSATPYVGSFDKSLVDEWTQLGGGLGQVVPMTTARTTYAASLTPYVKTCFVANSSVPETTADTAGTTDISCGKRAKVRVGSFQAQQQSAFSVFEAFDSDAASPIRRYLRPQSAASCSVPETTADTAGTTGFTFGRELPLFSSYPRNMMDAAFIGDKKAREIRKPGFQIRPQGMSAADIQPADLSFGTRAFQGGPAPVMSESCARKTRAGFTWNTALSATVDSLHPLPLHQSLPVLQPYMSRSAGPEALKLRWTKIFQMQHLEGYWELTTALGDVINVDVDLFANVFLKSKGIRSLGVKAHADILKLVATLLVLQLMRVEKLEEGKLLCTLFRLDFSSQPRPEHWEEVKRAVDWVCWADQQYPCVYSRLEFGLSWESSTRQLLGYEGLPPSSPLSGLNLQRSAAPLLVH